MFPASMAVRRRLSVSAASWTVLLVGGRADATNTILERSPDTMVDSL